jgi:multidrug efflux pump subunit AcrA (membrane-fusion protein)
MRSWAALVTVALTAGCAARPAPPPSAADPPPPPRIVVAQAAVVAPALVLSGIVAPLRSVTLSAETNAPATSVYAKEGDVVRRGQVLAELDTSELRASYAAAQRSASEADARAAQSSYQARLAIVQGVEAWRTAQDGVAQAGSKLRQDRLTYERNRALVANGYVPQAQVDESQALVVQDLAALRSAAAALRQARETVGVNGDVTRGLQASTVDASRAAASSAHSQAEQIAAQISKTTIRAPFDAIVVARDLDVGEYPGSRALFTLQASDEVYAMLSATAPQVSRVRPGMHVRVDTPHGAASADGVVEAVLPQTAPGSTSFTVKARIPNAGARFASGMVVDGTVQLAHSTGVAIPASAFVDAAHTSVAVVRGGHATVVPVRVLGTRGAQSVVAGIASGTRLLADGATVATTGQAIAGN